MNEEGLSFVGKEFRLSPERYPPLPEESDTLGVVVGVNVMVR